MNSINQMSGFHFKIKQLWIPTMLLKGGYAVLFSGKSSKLKAQSLKFTPRNAVEVGSKYNWALIIDLRNYASLPHKFNYSPGWRASSLLTRAPAKKYSKATGRESSQA
jgi:hypothetical protein